MPHTLDVVARDREVDKDRGYVGSRFFEVFDNAVLSHNGDSVMHVNHPTWRADRQDSATATRVGGRKVR